MQTPFFHKNTQPDHPQRLHTNVVWEHWEGKGYQKGREVGKTVTLGQG